MRSLAAESIADALMGIGLMNVVNYEHLVTAEGTSGIKARALVAARRR